MIDVKEIGRRLKEVRGDMSQSECASRLNISRAALSYYENGGRAIDTTVLCEFCKLFNVSSDYILGISENKTTNKDIKTACAVTGLSEEAIQSVININEKMSLEDLNYILKSPYFVDILEDFLHTRIQKKLLYAKDKTNWAETVNAYLDELGIEQTGRASRLHLDLVFNGIEYIYKQRITENAIKLFDEYKEYILSRPCYMYPVCLYPNSSGYTAIVPDLPGCITEGDTILDALDNAIDAASGWVLDLLEDNKSREDAEKKPVPEPTPIEEIKADEYEGGFTRMITLDIKRECSESI